MKRMIVCALIIACLFNMAGCGQTKGESEDIQDIIVNKTFVYEKEGFCRFVYFDGEFSDSSSSTKGKRETYNE